MARDKNAFTVCVDVAPWSVGRTAAAVFFSSTAVVAPVV